MLEEGAKVANQFQMTVGVALSAEQMEALTGDLVWLVEKEVQLPDGRTEKALVPTVYLAKGHEGDLKSTGVLTRKAD